MTDTMTNILTNIMANTFTGVQQKYYDEEQTIIQSEVYVCNGKMEGKYTEYFLNGKFAII